MSYVQVENFVNWLGNADWQNRADLIFPESSIDKI